jgi:tol-pal system beta propeller repeat protein TolB
VWPVLTGQPGLFSTKIAYSKEVRKKGKKVLMEVWHADFDGGNAKLLPGQQRTINMSPRWNRDSNNPMLFYSEHTNKKVQLVAVDMVGRRKVVSNFDGVNMQVAFSSDGKKAVFSSSRGGGTCQLYFYEQGKLQKLTHNNGNNIAPSFSDDAQTLFYCSDAQTKSPQIYRYEFKTGKAERVTDGGFCVSPSYCQHNDMLAYSKMVGGTMQVFLYDLKTKTHQQVTFDAGNKDECSWSPCGNYLLFAVETRQESRLAVFNRITKDQRFVTPKGSVCCYPSWSASYNEFPTA